MTEHEILADALRKCRTDLLAAIAQSSGLLGPLIIPDLPGYESPVTGKLIEGRRARREDLKRNGCVEYDPGMKDDAARRASENEAKLDAAIGETVDTIYNTWSSEKRSQLDKFDRRR